MSIEAHEIVLGTPRFTVETTARLAREHLEDAIRVEGFRGTVRLDRTGRRLSWKPESPLPPGRHVLVIGELISTQGRRLTPGRRVPFALVTSRSRVPRSVVVRSFARLVIEDLTTRRLPPFAEPRGRFLELIKGTLRGKRSPVAVAFESSGRRVDAERILRELQVKRVRRFGKLHEHLYRRLREAPAGTRLPVAIWVAQPKPPGYPTRPRPRGRRTATLPAAMRAERSGVTAAMAPVLERLTRMRVRRVRADRAAPAVNAWLTPAEIRAIQRRPDVTTIFLRDPRGFDDLQDSITIANSDDVHASGTRGANVPVAVWERHPANTADLPIVDQFDATPDTSNHSTLTHAIVANTEANAPHGHAPSCLLHSANDYDLDALEWAVLDEGCTVISQSFHRDEEQTSGGLSYDDIYKDWLALHWPWPTIVQAAGNGADDEYVNHKGFNSLAVGNHDDSAAALAGDSVFRNPDAAHDDRELPEISANGVWVTAAGVTDAGTSFAAPAVAGIAALLQNANTGLSHWPEGNRAILLAGATRNVEDQTWWADVADGEDAGDGAGAVNALESFRISRSKRSRNNRPSQRGWDVGSLDSSDFNRDGLSRFSYRVRVPNVGIRLLGPRHVKAALAWTSDVTTLDELFPWWPLPNIPVKSALSVDLDLVIEDAGGVAVGYSGSWDNSYEIAEFTGVPGATYDIRIYRASGTRPTWYGVAWTVTGGWPLDALTGTDLIRAARRLADDD